MFDRLRAAVCLVALSLASSAAAASLPTGFFETPIATGLDRPTAMAFAPDGRIFVCQQGGALRVVKDGTLMATPFVSLTVDDEGERGLLGVAFDPSFASNQYVYVYYTATTPAAHNRISRFTANGDVAAGGSEVVLLDLNNLSGATNHNGGAIHFGLDGKLYAAVGENANGANAQTLGNLLGKVLRINADGTIPTDNPFYGTASGNNRAIWALGLRNPFTFAFQPVTGRMFINDVGNSTWEEIDDGLRGANYGWPSTEGPTSNPSFVSPLFAYGHGSSSTTGCAIAGGAFYNPAGAMFPADYVGDYFFADLCSGWIRRYDPASGIATGFATGLSNPVDLAVPPDGSLYYLMRGGGSSTGVLTRVTYSNQDASGDGRGDGLLRRGTTGEVRVLQSTGSTFTNTVWSGGFVDFRYDVYYADVTGDGRADLVSRNRETGNVEVFRSTGTTFAYLAGTGPGGVWSYGWSPSYDLYFADANGDGRADLVGRLRTTGDIYVFASTGSGFSSAGATLWSYGWSSGYDLYFADVTGDGKADLVSRYFGPTAGLTGNVYVGASTGSGFASPTLWTYGFSAGYEMFFAQVTGDGRADLVARYTGNVGNGDVYVMRSTGSTFVWDDFDPWTTGWEVPRLASFIIRDVTADGLADIVTRNDDNNSIVVAPSTGSTFGPNASWASAVDGSYKLY